MGPGGNQQFVDLQQKGMDAGRQGLMDGAGALNMQVQKGTQGVSMLAFLGGALLTVLGIFDMFRNPFTGFVWFIINVYQLAFGIITCLLEAQPDWYKSQPKVAAYQQKVAEYAKFLTLLLGRGLFYVFIGSLTFTVSWTAEGLDVFELLIGIYVLFVGILSVGMHFNPDATRQYMQSASDRAGPQGAYPQGP